MRKALVCAILLAFVVAASAQDKPADKATVKSDSTEIAKTMKSCCKEEKGCCGEKKGTKDCTHANCMKKAKKNPEKK